MMSSPLVDNAVAVAHRRRVVGRVAVAGAGMLGLSFYSEPGSRRFYVLTLGVASTWLVGGLCSGPRTWAGFAPASTVGGGRWSRRSSRRSQLSGPSTQAR